MKFERTKFASKGIFWGVMLNFHKIIMKFIMRTALIYFLGIEFSGLDSLFISLLKVLSLAELGVGSALTFSMYKPIAENDEKTICALIKLYKIYYRIIGVVVLILGLILCPFIHIFIKANIPDGINIYVLYIINLFATVFSYWLFAYKNSILVAHQRNDVISIITIVVTSIQYGLQYLALFLYKNFYVYIILTLVFQIILNIVTALVSNKLYPKYKPYGTVEKQLVKDINQKVKDLFTTKIGGIILTSADSIVISSFLGLSMLAIYENYYYVLTAVMAIVNVIYTVCTAGIGNSLIIESKEKNYYDLKKFSFMLIFIITVCTACIVNSIQNFIRAWVGTKFLLESRIIICLGIYFYIYQLILIFSTYKDAAGIWHKDRYRTIISSLVNLILNIILINYIGIYGVILSTVLSLAFIALPWILYNIFTEIFPNKLKDYLKNLFIYIIISIGCIFVCYFCTKNIVLSNSIAFFVKNIITVLITTLIWGICFYKTDIMKDSINMVKKMLHGIFK